MEEWMNLEDVTIEKIFHYATNKPRPPNPPSNDNAGVKPNVKHSRELDWPINNSADPLCNNKVRTW